MLGCWWILMASVKSSPKGEKQSSRPGSSGCSHRLHHHNHKMSMRVKCCGTEQVRRYLQGQGCCNVRGPGGGACMHHCSALLQSLQVSHGQAVQVHRRFCEDDNRITAWFDTFSMEGMQCFGPGAKALANYSLRERANVWCFLQWRHSPKPPVAVTRRPVLFSELSVVSTIRHLLQEHPNFFRSRDLAEACRCAAWVSCSTPFFAEV